MMINDHGRTLIETATALCDGDITAVDLTKAHLARIDILNPALNAFNDIDADGALAAAEASAKRFAASEPLSMLDGIPVAIKNCLAVKALPHTAGIKGFQDQIANGDAHVVKKLREAGAIILGTTNMDEGALGTLGDNSHYGRTYNPLGNNLTPGGSSGGSAVAVASGMAMAAIGTDTLGNVRIPASFCGIVGFKPSRNLLDTLGLLPLSWTLDTIGTLARTADDAFLTIAAMLGIPMDPAKLPTEIKGMVLGIPWDLLDASNDLTAEVRTAFEQAIDRFKELGAIIKPVTLAGYEIKKIRHAAWLVCEVEAAEFHLDTIRDNPDAFSKNLLSMMKHGAQASDQIRVEALTHMSAMGDIYSDALLGIDAIITPTTPTTAFKFDSERSISQADFTTAANLVGAPSIAVPFGKSDESGLPFSLQITCDGLNERKAATIARVFERAVNS